MSTINGTESAIPTETDLSYSSAAYKPMEILYPYGYDPPSEQPPPPFASLNHSLLLEHSEKLRIMHANVEKRLEEFSMARQNIRHAIEYHRSVLAPIRRLPADVLIEIFALCLQAEKGLFGQSSPFNTSTIPCTLSYVCRQWRSVVLSTPLLWPRGLVVAIPGGDVYIKKPTRAPPKGPLELLTLYLDRSYPMPLEIWLGWSVPNTQDHQENSIYQYWNAAEVFRKLFQHTDRFTSLHLDFQSSSEHPFPNVLPTGDVAFSQLDSVSCGNFLWDPMPPWLANTLSETPNLRAFSAASEALNYDPSLPPEVALPFLPRITSLCLGSFSDSVPAETALSVMAATPNLEECRLSISPDLGPVTSPSTSTITLPHLAHLYLVDDLRFINDLKLLSRLILPSLKELRIATKNRSACIQSLIRRSHCLINVLTLDISNDNIGIDNIAGLLRELPALWSLKVTGIGDPYNLIVALTDLIGTQPETLVNKQPKDRVICPQLRCLELSLWPPDDPDETSLDWCLTLLTELVRSRSVTIGTGILQMVVITYMGTAESPSIDVDLARKLRDTCRTGGCTAKIKAPRLAATYAICEEMPHWVFRK